MRVELQAIQAEALDALKAVKTPDALESLRNHIFWTQREANGCHEGHGQTFQSGASRNWQTRK